jgi:microcystin-dependent protein
LRNRFVIGAGTGSSYAIGDTGGSANAVVVSHTHTTTVTDPGHAHLMSEVPTEFRVQDGVIDGSYSAGHADRTYTSRNTGSAVTSISVAVNTAGSSATNANLPPYYALCYIMKA